MAKKQAEEQGASELEALAVRLDAMVEEAEAIGEAAVVKSIRSAAKSCRWADTQRATRVKRVGGIIARLKAQGLSAEAIIARLGG